MNIMWFLPTQGDGHYLGTAIGGRETTFSYIKQIAIAVDELGYSGVLIPTGLFCEDPWTVAAAVAPLTNRLRFLVAVRPGIMQPTVAARMAATVDRISGGRLDVNVVSGGSPPELAADGVFATHDERYQLTGEFIDIWCRLLAGETVTMKGKHLEVRDARLLFPAVQRPHPRLFNGGSSAASHSFTAEKCDVYMTWGEPPRMAEEKIRDVQRRAAAYGRKLQVGMRLHVVVRETESKAWEAADDLIKYLDDETIARAQAAFAAQDSVGQQRMTSLHGGRRDQLVVSPNLWAGVGLVRGGAGTAIVGDPKTVAARLVEYQQIGVDTFILSGYPHLEEAYRFAELVFPLLPLKPSESQVAIGRDGGNSLREPVGEVIAHVAFPGR